MTVKEKDIVGIVGLGYVGLSVAVGLSEEYSVIGFDINEEKIASLQNQIDTTHEVSAETLKKSEITFTTNEKSLALCQYIIVAVPTPVSSTNEPNLTALETASTIIGKNLSPYTVVIYESTVYPGTTEEVCIPILEKASQLKAGIDFFVGYSPERINPGDKKHTFKNNNKVVAGQNKYTLDKVYELYDNVLDASVYKARSIKVAEASKLVENIQRDTNIALMNELAIIFKAMKIDTSEVLAAANTKWNFLLFSPGLVGGHCIGVDPYYLIYQSRKNGYEPNFLTATRAINDQMPSYIVQSLLTLIVQQRLSIADLKITVLGITFKENIPDTRNSKTLEIVEELLNLGLSVQVCDPHAAENTLLKNNCLMTKNIIDLEKAHIVIFSVPHDVFNYRDKNFFTNLLIDQTGIIMDIKRKIPSENITQHMIHWKL